jgi:hypothetical protein
MKKGVTPEQIIKGGKEAKKAGLELSFYILIGAGGKNRLENHALESAKICNQVNPDFIRLRTLVVQHGSLLEQKMKSGEYQTTSPIEKLKEVKLFLEKLNVNNCTLASDHFTNNIWVKNKVIYSGVYGILPQDKKDMLDTLNNALHFLSTVDSEVIDATILYERGIITSL